MQPPEDNRGADVSPVLPSAQATSAPLTDLEQRRTRRHLPHWQKGDAAYFVTFRVARGSLTPAERQVALDAVLYWNHRRWYVYAVTIMTDHVHLLVQPLSIRSQEDPADFVRDAADNALSYSLPQLLHSVKSFSAHAINRARGRTGPVWQDESWDRLIRDGGEFETRHAYICANAVEKGLAAKAFDYPYLWCEGMKEDRDREDESQSR